MNTLIGKLTFYRNKIIQVIYNNYPIFLYTMIGVLIVCYIKGVPSWIRLSLIFFTLSFILVPAKIINKKVLTVAAAVAAFLVFPYYIQFLSWLVHLIR